eukprot:2670072-Rhodomonas_salina.1
MEMDYDIVESFKNLPPAVSPQWEPGDADSVLAGQDQSTSSGTAGAEPAGAASNNDIDNDINVTADMTNNTDLTAVTTDDID